MDDQYPVGYRFTGPMGGGVHRIVSIYTPGFDAFCRDEPKRFDYMMKNAAGNRSYVTHEFIRDACTPVEEVAVLDPWTTCPACGRARWHLFGARHAEPTGEMVKSLELVGPIKVHWVEDGDLPDSELTPAVIVDRPVLSDQVGRECRDCGHHWSEEVGRKVDHNG